MTTQMLLINDLPSLANLTPEDWPDIVPHFDFYTKSSFCIPIKVLRHNKIVGIGTSIIHHDTAWLAHIIVHPDYRNQGIGQLITQALVDISKSKSCNTINLIATNLGVPVYEKLGFVTETSYIFFKDIQAAPSWTISSHVVPYSSSFRNQIESLDSQVSMENRTFHLEPHLQNGFVYMQDDKLEGYYLPTFDEGLIIANTALAGIELMKLRLATRTNAAFPIDNISAVAFLHAQGFREIKTSKRMILGQKKDWQPTKIYNRIGGNLG